MGLALALRRSDQSHTLPDEDIEAQQSSATCPGSWGKDVRARTSPEGL